MQNKYLLSCCTWSRKCLNKRKFFRFKRFFQVSLKFSFSICNNYLSPLHYRNSDLTCLLLSSFCAMHPDVFRFAFLNFIYLVCSVMKKEIIDVTFIWNLQFCQRNKNHSFVNLSTFSKIIFRNYFLFLN